MAKCHAVAKALWLRYGLALVSTSKGLTMRLHRSLPYTLLAFSISFAATPANAAHDHHGSHEPPGHHGPPETPNAHGGHGAHSADNAPHGHGGMPAAHWSAPAKDTARVNPVQVSREGLLEAGDLYREN